MEIRERGSPARKRDVFVVVAAQYLAVVLGCASGFAVHHNLGYSNDALRIVLGLMISPHLLAPLAIWALVIEWVLSAKSPTPLRRHSGAGWLCLVLAAYAEFLILADPFAEPTGDVGFVTGVHLLLPFLLAISVLVRSKAWLGVVAAVLFFKICLSMLIYNWSSSGGYMGFSHGIAT
jgi:hypothetical protein